jgi:hypothetical protein
MCSAAGSIGDEAQMNNTADLLFMQLGDTKPGE